MKWLSFWISFLFILCKLSKNFPLFWSFWTFILKFKYSAGRVTCINMLFYPLSILPSTSQNMLTMKMQSSIQHQEVFFLFSSSPFTPPPFLKFNFWKFLFFALSYSEYPCLLLTSNLFHMISLSSDLLCIMRTFLEFKIADLMYIFLFNTFIWLFWQFGVSFFLLPKHIFSTPFLEQLAFCFKCCSSLASIETLFVIFFNL